MPRAKPVFTKASKFIHSHLQAAVLVCFYGDCSRTKDNDLTSLQFNWLWHWIYHPDVIILFHFFVIMKVLKSEFTFLNLPKLSILAFTTSHFTKKRIKFIGMGIWSMWDMVQFIMANRYEKVRGIYTAKMEGQKAAVLHLSSSDSGN